ncbi:MAG: class I SAM-dependent methyltransferase [Patescibacteria group bacterium]|nr:class I SAM-dependent methyltransferase [Patescibacteria group bacterium]
MILKCRSCGGKNLATVFSLGFMPLANAFLTKEQLEEPEQRYPLDLMFCSECTLVQIMETVEPEILFRNYFYTSSVSNTTLENAKEIALRMVEKKKLNENHIAIEIGSNDGYLLKNYVGFGIRSIGIDPAKNLASVAKENGVETWCGFFNLKMAKDLKEAGLQADVLHANNVLAHVADLHGVVEGIAHLLKPDGVAVIETQYVRDMVDGGEFDCIYHEHLCQYSAESLAYLFQLHGMVMVNVEKIGIHGGSLRAYFQREDGPKSMMDKTLVDHFLWDESHDIQSPDFYRALPKRATHLRTDLMALLHELKAKGKTVAVYGAPAKSTTLLNYFGIGKDLISHVVDRTPSKQGHFTPGTHLEIMDPEKAPRPDYYLLATWNFADEIIKRQEDFRESGGRFIVPIPQLRIV